jgi:tetratricopeptide (TPR) repeat protein
MSQERADMPLRPRSHEIEEEQRIAFGQLMSGWVFRPLNSDYGIDGEVEIFEDGAATGLVFLVQLKATDAVSLQKALSVRISMRAYNYYRSREQPVLVVRYHAPSKRMFALWFASFRILGIEEGQKTVTLGLSEEDELTHDSRKKLTTDLLVRKRLRNQTLPFFVRIRVEFSQEWDSLQAQLIRSAIRKRCDLAGRQFHVCSDTDEACEVRVEFDVKRVVVWAGFERSFGVDLKEGRIEALDLQPLAGDVMFMVAFVLGKLGLYGIAARIVAASTENALILQDSKFITEITGMVAASGDTSAALRLVERMLASQSDLSTSHMLGHAITHVSPRTEETSLALQAFLYRLLESAVVSGVPRDIGICHYNLGNLLRRTNPRLALRHYRKAAEYDAGYLERCYWWGEMAGLLFNANEFRRSMHWYQVSARLYLRAVELDAGLDFLATYADALLFCGRFIEAEHLFDEYLRNAPQPEVFWHLKYHAVRHLRKSTGFDTQDRLVHVAEKIAGEATERGGGWESALQADALCVLAWLNLGVAAMERQDYPYAFFHFLVTALNATWDIEAWCFAVIAAIQAGDDFGDFAYQTILAACLTHGDDFVEMAYEVFTQKVEGGPTKALMELISSVAEHSKQKQPSILRALNDDGSYDIVYTSEVPTDDYT